jgi:hypothetical protein
MEQLLEAVPIKRLPSRAQSEPLVPDPLDVPMIFPQTVEIRRAPKGQKMVGMAGFERRPLTPSPLLAFFQLTSTVFRLSLTAWRHNPFAI